MAKPTFTDLWELLNYDFETGKLWWRPRDRVWFKNTGAYKQWNKRWPNTEALAASLTVDKYKAGSILNKKYKAHHVIWTMCYGYWPTKHIDHIDGNRINNRIGNLREVTNAENMKNQAVYSSSKSGVHGVTFRESHKRWLVRANIGGKRIHLGYYDSFEEAVQVRKQAEIDYGYHPNHGRPGR